MKKIYTVLLSCTSLIANAQIDISIEGEDTVCTDKTSHYTVKTSTYPNHYVYRDTAHLESNTSLLRLGYNFDEVTNTFSYDLWVKPTRTINMKGESNACAGDVSVPLANSGQNWAIVPVGLDGGNMSVGLTIGTNGLMVGEHSGNILVSRLSYTTAIMDWAHVAIVYRTDSIFLHLNGDLVRSRAIHCSSNMKCATERLAGYYYSPDFKGNIDEFRLWDIALTPSRVREIKDKKLAGKVNGLRYYASFDDKKFERTLGDIGTKEMTVMGMSTEGHIKLNSNNLNTYSGTDIDNLSLFSPENINYKWSTGEVGSSVEYIPVDLYNLLSVEGTFNGSTVYDTIEIVGKECHTETYYDTIQVYDTITVQNYGSSVPQEDLGAYFPFNGNANDESGNGHDGTVYGAELTEDRFGNPNSAYFFDGLDDRIDLGSDLIISGQNISYSCWFRSAENGIIISAGNRNSYILMKSYPDSIHSGFYLSDASDGYGSDTRKINIDPEQWHHAVVTYDGINHNFFIDGVLADTRLAGGDVFSNQSVYQNFGVYQYFGSNFQGWFKGEMDEIRFYNKVLNDQEVHSLYTENLCVETVYDTIFIEEKYEKIPEKNLVSHYPFNGNANDLGQIVQNGTVNGAVLTTDRNDNENSAYYFDGVDDFIEIPDSIPISNDFSISFWAFCEDSTAYSNILSDGSSSAGGNDFLINFRNKSIGIRADKHNKALNYENYAPAPLSDLDIVNKWVHVTWTMNPVYSKVYLNGEEIAQVDKAGTNSGYHDKNSYIGARCVWGSPDNHFKGKLDEIRIYNTELKPDQVSTLYAGNMNEYIYDTIYTTIADTVFTKIIDTTYVTVYDTVRNHYQEGLISYYPFNGDASDHGTRGKDGKVSGAELTEDRNGKANRAYYFDGVDDYIEIPDSLAVCEDFTIAFWAKSESTGTGNILCDGSARASGNDFLINFRDDAIGLRADKSGSSLNLEYSGPSTLSGLRLRNKWVHITWVMNSGYSKVYLDGDEIASLDIKGSNRGFHDAFTYIGMRKVWNTKDNFFKGSLDDIRIYNTPLRAAQVSALYRDEAIELDTISTFYERISVTDTLIIDAELTGYNAPFNQNTLKVYPNPAKDHVFINTGNYTLMNGYKIRIFNQLGVTVFETDVEEALYEINLSTWTGKGLYFLQLIDNRGNIMDIRKIVLR